MTAFDLIDSIFSRVQAGMPGNVRRVTNDQVRFLFDLIGSDPEGGHVKHGVGRSLVWAPSGRNKYVLTDDVAGGKHTLTRLSNLVATESGRLF